MFNATRLARLILSQQPAREISDHDLEYLLWICSLYVKLERIPGHIAEIGVASGRNAVLFGHLIKIFGDTSVRQYIGFDTFDGYTEADINRDKHLSATNERWRSFTKKGVEERCRVNGVNECVELFEGDASREVPIILRTHRGKKFQPGRARFALVYIDCNAFTPAINSLNAFLPHMSPGGFFAIDEKLQGGESEALLEFARTHKLSLEKPGVMQVPMIVRASLNQVPEQSS